MASASGTDAAIPKSSRFIGRRLRPKRPIVNAGSIPLCLSFLCLLWPVQDFPAGPF
jgi:hypothetical protein